MASSNVGNFGILTRQRAQSLPFIIVLFCLPWKGTPRRLADLDAVPETVAYNGVVPSTEPPVLALAPRRPDADSPPPPPAPDGDAAQAAVSEDS